MVSKEHYARFLMVFVLFAVLATWLIGCQGSSIITGKGDQLQQGAEIAIAKSGEHSGNYQTNNVTIDYTYTRPDPQTLEISGTVTYSSALQQNFSIINYFNLGIFLADASGYVFGMRDLATGQANFTTGGPTNLTFNKTLQIPAATALMAFRYEGQAQGDMHGEPTEFFQDPIVH